MKTKNGQHLHTTAQKSESLPISLNIQTETSLSKDKHNTAKHQTQEPRKNTRLQQKWGI
jgi:hypothetical protein